MCYFDQDGPRYVCHVLAQTIVQTMKSNCEMAARVSQLFHVGYAVQNRRSTLSPAWHEWFSRKRKEWKIYCCGFVLSSKPQIWKICVAWPTTSKNCIKKRAARAARSFFLIQLINRWFVRLSKPLSFSFLKLSISSKSGRNIYITSSQ